MSRASLYALFSPFFVLAGGEQTKEGIEAVNALASIYAKWIDDEKIIKTNTWSSELSKLVSIQGVRKKKQYALSCPKTSYVLIYATVKQ